MDTARFITESARRGLSKTQVREALGVSRDKFWEMLKLLPDLAWAPRGKSLGHRLSNESRRGQCTPKLRAALEIGRARRREKALHEVDGRKGTLEELAQHYKVSASTVRRRLAAGLTLDAALKTPPVENNKRREGLRRAA